MCNNADLRVPKEIYQEIRITKETYLFQKGPNKRICTTKKNVYQKRHVKRPMYNKRDVFVSKETYLETNVKQH